MDDIHISYYSATQSDDNNKKYIVSMCLEIFNNISK